MDLPPRIDECIKDAIDHTLGLSVSTQTLESRLRASEEVQKRLREECSLLHSRLNEKDGLIERARAESCMNAQALKKFVEENQKLAAECANLLAECKKLETECSLYDHDREALMDFGNEVEERAKEAEARVQELEEELQQLSDELQHKDDTREDEETLESTTLEEKLVESIISTLLSKDAVASAYSFLEANSAHESCQELLKMWNCLRPATRMVISLAAEMKTLEKDKENLRINLHKAEEEVNLLFQENNVLDEENKRLLRHCQKERDAFGSGGRITASAPAKSNKRKSSPKMSSPVEKRIDLSDVDSPRRPLSPLKQNSPDSRVYKK
ncbi:myosin-4 [Rhodamnia argentea]|uniref:Myosin-4 n=1 Tax=Rhodamnia argentea TaxID=178133 RepID=A0A8B8Q6P1_9MYRT|nr:myosin-4 [Rhodamnia argentea]